MQAIDLINIYRGINISDLLICKENEIKTADINLKVKESGLIFYDEISR